MMTFENIADIKVITIEGSTFIGEYEKAENGTMKVTKAMKADDENLNKEFFLKYILADNAGELKKPINVDGHAVAAYTELTDDQVFDFESALRQVEFQAPRAEASMVNDFIRKSM